MSQTRMEYDSYDSDTESECCGGLMDCRGLIEEDEAVTSGSSKTLSTFTHTDSEMGERIEGEMATGLGVDIDAQRVSNDRSTLRRT